MSAGVGSTEIERVELCRLVDLYYLEEYLFGRVSSRFGEEGTLAPYDFFAIIVWKSNRAKTKIRRGLDDAGVSAEVLMREVHEADTPRAKVEALLRIRGIGLAMASAVLTVCYPEEFTVLDYRAWGTLCRWSVEGLPARYPGTSEKYLQYCQACRALADKKGLSLRDLDRALWAKSWEDDLLDLIDA